MERKTVVERLEEVKEELGINWSELGRRVEIHQQVLYDILWGKRGGSLQTVEKVGYGLGYIPVAFLKRNGRVEDLGLKGFLQGRKIKNYVGRVFRKYREREGLTIHGLSRIVGLDENSIAGYERGEITPNISSLEAVCEGIDLVPAYLLPRRKPRKT